jgi:hypothetical protein
MTDSETPGRKHSSRAFTIHHAILYYDAPAGAPWVDVGGRHASMSL